MMRLLLVALALFTAVPARAQSPVPTDCTPSAAKVSNPNWLVFGGSPDHAAAYVTGYRVGIYADGVTPSNTVDNFLTAVFVPKSELIPIGAAVLNCWGTRLDTVTTMPLLATPIALVTPYRAATRTLTTVASGVGPADWSIPSNAFDRVASARPATNVTLSK